MNTEEELFLSELRARTKAHHEQLERNPVSKALQSENVTPGNYREYLEKMYGLVMGVEQTVFPMLNAEIGDLHERKKASLLVRDLTLQGLSEEEIMSLPLKDFAAKNINQAFGIFYVLEGSTLGGKILYKHINKTLSFSEQTGNAFFNGYGEKTGSNWKSFLQLFASYAVRNKAQEEIIKSADDTFKEIDEWMAGTA